MNLSRFDPNLQAGVAFLCGFVLPTAVLLLFLRPSIDTLPASRLYLWIAVTIALGLAGIFAFGLLPPGLMRYWFGSLAGVAIALSFYMLLWLHVWWITAVLCIIVLMDIGFSTRIALRRERTQ